MISFGQPSMTILENTKRQAVESHKNPPKQEFKSFEEVYKTSYSHGLEAIYSLETIDLRTVKRISDQIPSTSQETQRTRINPIQDINQQGQFDFGTTFIESMDSFILEEPIKVLGLSRHAERCLYAQGLSMVKDLIKADLSRFVYLKGMGQGHIDEIEQRLKSYLKDIVLYRCSSVDFSAWMRSLFATFSSKKMYVFAEPFQLSHLFTLSPAESVEVRLLTNEKRLEWRQEMMSELVVKRDQLFEGMGRVVSAFIKPWLKRRFGLATSQEMVERLQRLADRPEIVVLTLDFFSALYFDGKFVFGDWFIGSSEQIFFSDEETKRRYDVVIGKAKTYFYKCGLHYGLSELIQLIARECAKEWFDYSEEFIEKCLRLSKNFRVRKGEHSRLIVRLA